MALAIRYDAGGEFRTNARQALEITGGGDIHIHGINPGCTGRRIGRVTIWGASCRQRGPEMHGRLIGGRRVHLPLDMAGEYAYYDHETDGQQRVAFLSGDGKALL